jgi:hypothetical protein
MTVESGNLLGKNDVTGGENISRSRTWPYKCASNIPPQNKLTNSWRRFLLEKSSAHQLPKKYSGVCGNRRFTTELTISRHWSLSKAMWLQHTFETIIRFVAILYSRPTLGLPSGFFLSRFLTKICYATSSFPCVLYSLPIISSYSVPSMIVLAKSGVQPVTQRLLRISDCAKREKNSCGMSGSVFVCTCNQYVYIYIYIYACTHVCMYVYMQTDYL